MAFGTEMLTMGIQHTAQAAQMGINYGMTETQRRNNYRYNEKAADNADQRERKKYNDLYSPEAQLKQLKAAGLSPSLMYSSGAGVGGTSTAGSQGSGAAGPMGNVTLDLASAMQAAANIELMKSETRKNNAEAEVTEQTGVENAQAQIAKAYADAGASEAAEALTRANTAWQNAQNVFAEAKAKADFDKAENEAELLYWRSVQAVDEARQAQVQADIAEETKNEAIKQVRLQTKQALENIGLTKKQIESLQNQINTNIKMVDIQDYNAKTMRGQIRAQVAQWAKENEYTESGQGVMKRGQNMSLISHIVGAGITGVALYVTKNPKAAVAAGAAATQATEAATSWF